MKHEKAGGSSFHLKYAQGPKHTYNFTIQLTPLLKVTGLHCLIYYQMATNTPSRAFNRNTVKKQNKTKPQQTGSFNFEELPSASESASAPLVKSKAFTIRTWE